MRNEVSCGAVLFVQIRDRRWYHLVRNRAGHIGFPKGHMESGETEAETALREIEEETGVRAILLDGFRHVLSYPLPDGRQKTSIYFIAPYSSAEWEAESDMADTVLVIGQSEISEAWLAEYGMARAMLTFENEQQMLDRADQWLNERFSTL